MKRYPLPPDQTALPVITARRFLQLGPGRPFPTVEGACFDREGRLLVGHREAPWSDVVRINLDTGESEIFYHAHDAAIIGLACHRDGRVFCADIHGRLTVLTPDGRFERDLLSAFPERSFKPNDLCFDNRGSIYFSDFIGTPAHPDGGIYRLDESDGYASLHLVAGELCTPNGVGFSPDFSVLWTSESLKNDVVRIAMDGSGGKHPHFSAQLAVYHNSGYPHVDSNAVDSLGNVYQAIMEGGRAIVLTEQGIPVYSVLLEDRESGRCMKTPNLAISPDRPEGYLLACGEDGAWVYKFDALAPAAPGYARTEGNAQ